MFDFIHSRLDFSAPNLNYQVLFFGVIIWLVVLGCAITSVLGQDYTPAKRRLWIALIVGLPVVGVLLYLPFSLRADSIPFIPFLKRQFKRD